MVGARLPSERCSDMPTTTIPFHSANQSRSSDLNAFGFRPVIEVDPMGSWQASSPMVSVAQALSTLVPTTLEVLPGSRLPGIDETKASPSAGTRRR